MAHLLMKYVSGIVVVLSTNVEIQLKPRLASRHVIGEGRVRAFVETTVVSNRLVANVFSVVETSGADL